MEVLGHDYSYRGKMVPVWNHEKGISWKLVETSKPKGKFLFRSLIEGEVFIIS